jgi:threonine dehydrogenase-like Zn-dependent dehydrogenase
MMRAIAVHPLQAGSIHLRDVAPPSLEDVADGRGALVDIIRVGVDGTDKEIADGLYGAAPEGDDFLVIGHENLGRVRAVGAKVPSWLTPGGLVVTTVRRPGHSLLDAIGYQDMSPDDSYRERGINRMHGFLTEAYVDDWTYMVPIPPTVEPVAVLLEPLTIAQKGLRQAWEIQRRMRIWEPRHAAVLGAGTVGLLAALAMRLRGLEVTVYSRRVAPYRNSELVEAIGGRYLSSSTATLDDLRSQAGPFDLVFDATGFSPLSLGAPAVLAKNGVLVLASVTGGDRTAELPTDHLNQGIVLGNQVIVGTVNAHRDDFVAGVSDLLRAEAFYPGWLARLITTRIPGLDGYAAMLDHLEHDKDAIKVVVEIGRPASASS